VLHHLPLRRLADLLHGRQEQTNENPDDGDDAEKLDERKAGCMARAPAPSPIEGLVSGLGAVRVHRGQRGELCWGHRASSEKSALAERRRCGEVTAAAEGESIGVPANLKIASKGREEFHATVRVRPPQAPSIRCSLPTCVT